MTRPRATLWNVMFIGDHAVVTTTVEARDDEQAEREAAAFVESYYGWDLSHFATEAEQA